MFKIKGRSKNYNLCPSLREGLRERKQKNTIFRPVLKFGILSVGLFLIYINLYSQNTSLSIEECYSLAEKNYPMAKQMELIQKSNDFSIDNISKGVWPQVSLNGQATYQSDVTSIPITIPGFTFTPLPKDQYKVYGEINQSLTDIITVAQQKKLQNTNSSIQQENLEADLYKLKDRINQLFFGALLIEEQSAQNELFKKDIQVVIDKINAAIKNGVEFHSSLDKMKAEYLKANERSIELNASRKAYLDMLSLFINQTLTENTTLQKPGMPKLSSGINRHELAAIELQRNSYGIQKKLLVTKSIPKLSLFFQGGYGQPSPLNMLSKEWKSYYITGLRFNWNLSTYYSLKKDVQIISLTDELLDVQKETFLLNTNITLKQQNAEIDKLSELIKTDDEIIALRTSVKNTSNIQLENGIITANDYLREVNAEDQAKQNRLLHEMQLLMAQYNYQFTAGN